MSGVGQVLKEPAAVLYLYKVCQQWLYLRVLLYRVDNM